MPGSSLHDSVLYNNLTCICPVNFSILINWTRPFPNLRMSVLFSFLFQKQTVYTLSRRHILYHLRDARHIWVKEDLPITQIFGLHRHKTKNKSCFQKPYRSYFFSLLKIFYIGLSDFVYFQAISTFFLFFILFSYVYRSKIIFKYSDCLKVVRIVFCKYKDCTRAFYQKYNFRAESHFESLFVLLVWYKEISLWSLH